MPPWSPSANAPAPTRRFAWLLGLTLALNPSSATAEEPRLDATLSAEDRQVVESVRTSLEQLRNAFNSPAAHCNAFDQGLEPVDQACSADAICRLLRPNASTSELYSNGTQGVIPNFAVLALDGLIRSCQSTLFNQMKIDSKLQREFRTRMSREISDAYRAFRDELARAGQTGAYLALLEVAEGTGALELTPADSPAQFEPIIRRLEATASVSLADPARRALASYLSLRRRYAQAPAVQLEIEALKGPALVPRDPWLLSRTWSSIPPGQKETRTRRLEEQVERVRARTIATLRRLKAARAPDQATRFDNLIERVRSVRFNRAGMFEGPCRYGPNAYYDGEKHALTACAQLTSFPEAALATVLVHEFGHAIDPCISTGPLLRRANGELVVDLELGKLGQSVLEAPSGTQVVPGIPGTQFPLQDVMSCLQSPASAAAQIPDPKGRTRAIDEAIRKRQALGETRAGSPDLARLLDVRDGLGKYMRDKWACAFIPGEQETISQAQETFADWLAGEVVADGLSGSPTERSSDARAALESVGFFTVSQCGKHEANLAQQIIQRLGELGCSELDPVSRAVDRAMIETIDPHLPASTRIDRIMLAHPRLREILACRSGPAPRYCAATGAR